MQQRLNFGEAFAFECHIAYDYRVGTYGLCAATATHTFGSIFLGREIDTKKIAHEEQRQYAADDSKRIGNRIGCGNFGRRAADNVAYRLLRGTEPGSVCNSTREHAHHCGYR